MGGQITISEDDYIEGAPELIAEVAASSIDSDLDVKKKVYLRNGVQEYLVWQVADHQLDWFRLVSDPHDHYVLLAPDADGILRSRIFPGLWLDVEAWLKQDMVRVLEVLQLGIRSPEHDAFVQDLHE